MERQKLWVLTKTEYEGQCTGFSEYKTLVCVWLDKPIITQLAPMLDGLNSEMGIAIKQVLDLIDDGLVVLDDFSDYSLSSICAGEAIEYDK